MLFLLQCPETTIPTHDFRTLMEQYIKERISKKNTQNVLQIYRTGKITVEFIYSRLTEKLVAL